MMFTVALLAALCLAVPVLSQDAPCKVILGAANFNFEKAIPYTYTYVLGPDTPEFKTYASAEESAFKIGDKYYSTFNVTQKDGTQLSRNYLIESVEGATIKAVLLNNGEPTQYEFTSTIYAYKPDGYALIYLCGGGGSNNDLRFAVLYGENKQLSDSLEKELLDNDSKFGFKGNLVRIGSAAAKKNELEYNKIMY